MRIISLVVGQMKANCFVLYDEKKLQGIVIDPGDDGDYIIEKINALKIKPKLILATHGHFDHNLASFQIQNTFKIPFMIHPADMNILNNIRSSADFFIGKANFDPPPHIDGTLKSDDVPGIGSFKLQVIHTPGHTPGSICLYSKKNRSLFCGDLIFAHGTVGRSDFSYSNPGDLRKSVLKILDLDSDIVVYPGHGEPTTVKAEREYHRGLKNRV